MTHDLKAEELKDNLPISDDELNIVSGGFLEHLARMDCPDKVPNPMQEYREKLERGEILL